MRGDYRPRRAAVNRDTRILPDRAWLSRRPSAKSATLEASGVAPRVLPSRAGGTTTMRDDWRLGISMLVAAAFAVAIAGCSSNPKPAWSTAHPDTAAATTEPTASPAAMAERAEAAV